MIAKIIAHAETREAALDRLAEALDATIVAGPRSNVAFLAALCRAAEFREGRFDTGLIDRHLASLGADRQGVDRGAAARGVARLIEREAERIAARRAPDRPASPWDLNDAFQLSGSRAMSLAVRADGEDLVAQVIHGAAGMDVVVDGVPAALDSLAIDGEASVYVLRQGRQTIVRPKDADVDIEHLDGDGVVRAPMHGKLLAVLVEAGAAVSKGQRVAIVEAMKMEHSLLAPIDGKVVEVRAAAGSQVAEGADILVIGEGE